MAMKTRVISELPTLTTTGTISTLVLLIRFGTGHIYNSYYLDVSDGINTRDGAQLLVESNVFDGCKKPLYSTDDGYAIAKDNDFGDGENSAEAGSLTSVPYSYTLLGSANVKAAVYGAAGQTLTF